MRKGQPVCAVWQDLVLRVLILARAHGSCAARRKGEQKSAGAVVHAGGQGGQRQLRARLASWRGTCVAPCVLLPVARLRSVLWLCRKMFATAQKTQELWMWKMEYLHHEQRPLYFGEWF